MEDSINQLKSKINFRVPLRTIWYSTLGFIDRVTQFFTLTDEEKTKAGIFLKE
jgi:hypothetical protein